MNTGQSITTHHNVEHPSGHFPSDLMLPSLVVVVVVLL